MAEQQQPKNWEERAIELAREATEQIGNELEEELRIKRERFGEVEQELERDSVAQRLEEKSQLEREIEELDEQLTFARDAIAPRMVASAAGVGFNKDNPPKKGCF